MALVLLALLPGGVICFHEAPHCWVKTWADSTYGFGKQISRDPSFTSLLRGEKLLPVPDPSRVTSRPLPPFQQHYSTLQQKPGLGAEELVVFSDHCSWGSEKRYMGLS
ncbi:hypothetical protein B296_00029875 [Ensete ventricosum]|uniref:Uncharacterized protein n=1 Tax=Ensete ventricosum TaxID=4639 RepID=A0A426XTZ3_ENSVE|nr:hypothetical protein B296_00029875 [Ensete ventricosum]